MWSVWQTKFSAIFDIHTKKSLWINSLLVNKMRERDSLKNCFDKNPNDLDWSHYKKVRDEVNHLVKKTKRDYYMTQCYSTNSNQYKTWRLINKLSSREIKGNSKVKTIKCEGNEITNPFNMANTFNTFFSCNNRRQSRQQNTFVRC